MGALCHATRIMAGMGGRYTTDRGHQCASLPNDTPVGAAEQVMIQTTGDVPWLKEEPLPGPVIAPVEQ